MRVLNLVTTAETRFFRQQVGELRKRGIESDVLAVPTSKEFDYGRDSGRTAMDYLRFVPMVWRASFGAYDLVHANYGLTAPAAVLQPNLPVVLSLWGTDLMGRYGPVGEWCARHCEEVVVMSEEMATYLDRDVSVIPHGVNLDTFQPRPKREARAELGWAADEYHVLFPYPPTREVKNFDQAERVVDDAAARLGERINLQTVSGEPHERMPLYHNAADCLLLTSDREGSPNSVKEAMACNTPVVATDVGDVRERLSGVSQSYVRDSTSGLVTALVAVLEAGTPSDGRRAARDITPAKTAQRLETVYRKALEDS
ncbi:glycosyltransferase [Halorubrum lacusprofundi]|uniref:glycosyltransferase n=1 Tax=Halorubrum lacusprofundi TaxID=2247 RepID=UPI000B5A2A91